ncbi:hypothetical protein CupriaWKF_18445 [Cupriavidus sp. WKF15]|uniref:hypothetical protein n=1 Tax=Cupriavidus sp. WKF15 TaxID=3032282 RepID=UPI0023E0E7BF|nr:hypothetical protein [Cupriavidus sp. WKF15]WER49151.1 hypothetical protein CupriaWKF_18445 [Cupriavidus sp. WKF15]
MKKNMLLAALLGIAAMAVHAAEPKCQSQTLGSHTSKLCISQAPFQHDYYKLWVDGAPIFTLPDDYVEDIALAHKIPEDAAIEFPLPNQGMPVVKISGGCAPISEKKELGGKMVGIEVGRSCSFKWGNVEVMKELRVSFE